MLPSRISDATVIDRAQIAKVVESGRRPTIQFSQPGKYPPSMLAAVNEVCAEFGDRIDVRFYAHYGEAFDAAVLDQIPQVGSLLVDSLTAIENHGAIARLPRLTRLGFGVFEFDRPDFLASLDLTRLTRLALAETRKRNFDLAPLATARRLGELFLNGHARNIEVVSTLPTLERVSLAGFPKRHDLAFLNELAALRTLTLALGSRESIAELSHPRLSTLEVLRVRDLKSLGRLSRFPSLENLRVEDQLHIATIDLADIPLRTLAIDNCKTLTELEGLATLDRLTQLHASRTRLDYDALAERAWPKSLEVIALYPGSARHNADIRAKLDARGYRRR